MAKDNSMYFPPASFHFAVSIDGDDGVDSMFQSVKGLSVSMEIESIKEGGENNFVHNAPKRAKYENLVLTRGFMLSNSDLHKWCENTIQSYLNKRIETKDINVSLINAEGETLKTWAFKRAFPVKWEISEFNAEQNKVTTETLEFAYRSFKITTT